MGRAERWGRAFQTENAQGPRDPRTCSRCSQNGSRCLEGVRTVWGCWACVEGRTARRQSGEVSTGLVMSGLVKDCILNRLEVIEQCGQGSDTVRQGHMRRTEHNGVAARPMGSDGGLDSGGVTEHGDGQTQGRAPHCRSWGRSVVWREGGVKDDTQVSELTAVPNGGAFLLTAHRHLSALAQVFWTPGLRPGF